MLFSPALHYDRRQAAAVRGDQKRIAQARVAAAALGDRVYAKFPFVSGMKPVTGDLVELVLNRTWPFSGRTRLQRPHRYETLMKGWLGSPATSCLSNGG
jgi:hypothetical protein